MGLKRVAFLCGTSSCGPIVCRRVCREQRQSSRVERETEKGASTSQSLINSQLSLSPFSTSRQTRMDNPSTPRDDDQDFSSSVAWDTTPPPPAANASSTNNYSAYTDVPTESTTTTIKKHRVDSVKVLDGKTELEGTSDMFVSYLVTANVTTLPITTATQKRLHLGLIDEAILGPSLDGSPHFLEQDSFESKKVSRLCLPPTRPRQRLSSLRSPSSTRQAPNG